MAPVGFWPKRGVYFCRESGEQKFDTGVDLRIVRVRTKALKAAFYTELWTRPLEQKGNWPLAAAITEARSSDSLLVRP